MSEDLKEKEVKNVYVKPAIFHIGDGINDKTNDSLQKFLDDHRYRENPTPEVELVINSGGGSLYSMVAILDRIIELNNEGITRVNTTVRGRANSAALYIFIVGYKRKITGFSVAMFHEARMSLGNMTPYSEINEILEDSLLRHENYLSLIWKHTSIPKTKIRKAIREKSDLIFTAEEMRGYLKDVKWGV